MPRPNLDEVEQLLLNAHLRDELEPYFDESVEWMSSRRLPTHVENEFLASMLAWERAPLLPIARWFEPALQLPPLEAISDQQVHDLLWETVQKLFEKRIVLELTDHLSDRQLYRVLQRDILPSYEKLLDVPGNYLHWQCLDTELEDETWLKYYASPGERRQWAEETGLSLPPSLPPPYARKLPRRTQNG